MKLYLLHLTDSFLRDYDTNWSILLRAENEEEARLMCSQLGGSENGRQIKSPWLNDWQSSCEELTVEGKSEIIMRDYKSG